MTSSAAFRCVQAWLLEKPAAWADADAASLAAALMVQQPPARAREDALLQAERLYYRLRIAGLCGELRERDNSAGAQLRSRRAKFGGAQMVREHALFEEEDNRETWRVRSWSAALRSSRKRTEIFIGGRTDELGLAQRKKRLKWRSCSDDFLGGLPLRAGMASGKAHCVGG